MKSGRIGLSPWLIRLLGSAAGFLSLVLFVFTFALPARLVSAPALPASFGDALVADVPSPTALAFTPDRRVLVATQLGQLRIIKNGQLLAAPAINLAGSVCTQNERGLLGVAVDPEYASNGHIFLYYTRSPTCVNRVSRFVLGTDDRVEPTSELVLIDNIMSGGYHNAGDLYVNREGHLYVSVGDGGGQLDARAEHLLVGKILRIMTSGGIPSSNPFQGSDSARCNVTGRTDPGKKCQETFAWGLRNPFRFAFDPNSPTDRFFINDVGESDWEEINLGQSGADYGWSIREGPCVRGSRTNCGPPPAGMTNPLYAYDHTVGRSITGGAFVPNGVWPAEYNGAYLFADYVFGTIFRLVDNGGTYSHTPFATGLGNSSAVHLAFGPYGTGQALYYTTYASGGEVRAITFAGNHPPAASAAAAPTFGATPLTVTLDATGSTDADGDALTYSWNPGDGSPPYTAATATHVYQTAGTYYATVTVRDPSGATGTATMRVDPGNRPPVPIITAPLAGAQFTVGQSLQLQGSATDPEEGPLAATQLSWTVTKVHDNHTHPFLPPTTGTNIPIVGPAPEDLASTATSYLVIRLTATDSRGLSATITQELRPALVNLTFATDPSGLTLSLNGFTYAMPRTVTSWPGYGITAKASTQTDSTGKVQSFASWSDGGAAEHAIVTPPVATTYTARFQIISNLALNRTGTASSVEGSGHPASNAFDGNPSTRWSSAFSDPQWIMVDLGSAQTIKRVVLRWETAFGTAYEIQVSPDGTNWTSVYTTATGDGGVDDLTGFTASGRYVRMYGTRRATSWGYSLYEFEVYTDGSTAAPSGGGGGSPPPASGTNLALSKPVTASSVEYEGGSLKAANVVDGLQNTRWSSAWADPQWIMVDLGTPQTVKRVVLRWESAYASGYEIQVSEDAASWTPVYTTMAGDGGVDDLTGFTAVGRYVRMFGTKRATPWGYSLFELEVYGAALNRAPVARATATPLTGVVPLSVTLDASTSTEPDGDAMTFEWNAGDGSPVYNGAVATHVYNTAGTFTATVTVRDPSGLIGTATVRIDPGNMPPTPVIAAPLASARFGVGQSLTLQGSATDPEEGPLAATQLSWTITKVHDAHTHAFLGPTTGTNIPFVAPPPEDFAAVTTSYLVIRLTATDSRGLSSTVTQELRPALVDVTLATDPVGLRVSLNGLSYVAPRTLTSWSGYSLTLKAATQTDGGGATQSFASWSDGGAAEHTVVTPAAATTYTARFQVVVTPPSAPPPSGPSGTTNLALNKPATASSLEYEGGGLRAANAVDGLPNTRWASAWSDPQWIMVDLGAPQTVRRVVLRWESAYAGSYEIQVSDDAVTWTSVYATATGDGGVDDLSGLNGSGRYIRMYGTRRPNPWGYSLYEFEVYGGAALNRAPVARATATPPTGPIPLSVKLDGSTSSDPDGDALTFSWSPGDGSPAYTTAAPIHTYQSSGTFTATLTVRDPSGATGSTTVRIDPGNNAPIPLITSPLTTARFAVGQTIVLKGEATDLEDGVLAASRLSWDVTVVHGSHTHPFLAATTGTDIPIVMPAPEDLAATTTSYLLLKLTATDSRGLSRSVTQELRPALVDVTVATDPMGLTVNVNGASGAAPRIVTSWPGYNLTLKASTQTDGTGTTRSFLSWSDGGAAEHVVVTPAVATTYTARFQTVAAPPPPPAAVTNLALNKPVTASSLEYAGGGLRAENAVDGFQNTRWGSAWADPQWIMVDLGTTRPISRVIIRWEEAYARGYEIQVSADATTWTTIYSTASGDGKVDDLPGLNGTGRYVRMFGKDRGTGWGYSLYEFEIY